MDDPFEMKKKKQKRKNLFKIANKKTIFFFFFLDRISMEIFDEKDKIFFVSRNRINILE